MKVNPTSKDEFRLEGKVALITGGARGIGAECGKVLAAAGAKVVLTDVLSGAGQATVESIVAAGGDAIYQDLNVTSNDEWKAAIETTVSKYHGFDILVNNAGIEIMSALEDVSPEDLRRLMSINVEAVFFGCQHAVTAMRPGGRVGRGGSIVNMSSIAGKVGIQYLTAYCASKGAVQVMTKAIAVECGRLGLGIRCNSVHPGLVNTEMAGALIAKAQVITGAAADVVEASWIGAHPIGRLGVPRDIANAVRYLGSDASAFVTGAELCVDGGWTAM